MRKTTEKKIRGKKSQKVLSVVFRFLLFILCVVFCFHIEKTFAFALFFNLLVVVFRLFHSLAALALFTFVSQSFCWFGALHGISFTLYPSIFGAFVIYVLNVCFSFSFLTIFSIFPCSTVGRRSMFWIYSSILLRYIVSVSQFGVQRCCLFRINVLHSVLVGLEFNIVN